MALQLFNAATSSGTSAVLTPVSGLVPDRVFFLVSTGADASLQVKVSADGVLFFDYDSPVSNGTGIVKVPRALWARVDSTLTGDTASAWVA